MYLLSLIFLQIKVWIKKNVCNLITSEIPNYLTYEGKHLESNSSGAKKNANSCNTLQKLRVNNTFSLAEFCEEGYSTPYRLDRTCKWAGLLLYLSDDILSKQIKLKFIENETFEKFFVETNLRKKSVFFAALIIQIKIKLYLAYMLLAKL